MDVGDIVLVGTKNNHHLSKVTMLIFAEYSNSVITICAASGCLRGQDWKKAIGRIEVIETPQG